MRMISQKIDYVKQHHAEFFLVGLLFFLFRMMMLMAYTPSCLMLCGDYLFYYEMVASAGQGQYPFIDFWYEFPPIFPYLSLGAYYLAQGTFHNYVAWLGFLLLLFECGVLILLYLLACRLYDQKRALKLSWIYMALFVPFYFWRSSFDSLTTFFILLILYALLQKKYGLMSVALGLGFMVKYIPIIAVPAIYRHSKWKGMIMALAGLVLISLVIFGPFFILSPEYAAASVKSQLSRSSWQTVWALIDGNLEAGGFGPMAYRFDAQKAGQPLANPPQISPLITLLIFGVIGGYLFLQPIRQPVEVDTVRFFAFTLLIFFLWSRGWSPQWQVYLIPLVLLALPLQKALVYIIGLGLVNFLEWPIIYQRGLTQLLPVTIISRTILFGLLAYEIYRLLTMPLMTPTERGYEDATEADILSV